MKKKQYFCRRFCKKEPCPDGGIGRRAGLKHQWSNPCRFDPGSGYELQIKGQAGDLNIRYQLRTG